MKLNKKELGMWMFFGILLIIAVFILYFAISYISPAINQNVLNLDLVFVLVIVTAVYAIAGAQIVRETQKDRRIRYLEKRLENLYSPLKHNPAFIGFSTSFSAADARYAEYRNFLIKLRENVYLASPALRKEIMIFLSGIDNPMRLEKSRQTGGSEWKEFVNAADKIKSIADEDIEKIIQELEKLTS